MTNSIVKLPGNKNRRKRRNYSILVASTFVLLIGTACNGKKRDFKRHSHRYYSNGNNNTKTAKDMYVALELLTATPRMKGIFTSFFSEGVLDSIVGCFRDGLNEKATVGTLTIEYTGTDKSVFGDVRVVNMAGNLKHQRKCISSVFQLLPLPHTVPVSSRASFRVCLHLGNPSIVCNDRNRRRKAMWRISQKVSLKNKPGLSIGKVRRSVHSQWSSIVVCAKKRISRNGERKSGTIRYLFEIGKRGKVRRIQKLSDSLNITVVDVCVKSSILRWRFPMSKNRTIVVYPFHFPG